MEQGKTLKKSNKSISKFSRAKRSVAILLAAMIVFTFLAWGVASSWGGVRISRVEYVSNGGATMSGWMFTPKGVNDQNPAPAIVNFHGRNTTAYNLVAWCIEQSRRGYVVFAPDQQRTNESLATEDNTTDRIAVSAIEYIYSQDFTTEVSATGHSAGNRALTALTANEEIQKKLTNIVSVGSMFMAMKSVPEYTNFLSIEATKDFYAYQWAPDKLAAGEKQFGIEGIESGVLYGDPLSGSARELLLLPTTHQQQMYNEDVLAAMLGFIELTSKAPNPIGYDNQVFPWCVILLSVCSLLLILFVAAFAYMLAASPLFCGEVLTELPDSKGKSGKKWLIQVAMDMLIPIALFVPVTKFIGKYNPTSVLRFGFVNRIFLWIFAVGLVGGVILIFRYRKVKKERTLTAEDFGMGNGSEPVLVWKRVLDGFLIASITTFVMFSILDIVCRVTGLNYQFFNTLAQMNRLTPERFIASLPYVVLCVMLLIVININIATSRRAKTTGNETKDTIRDIFINAGLSAGALTLILIVQFGGIRIDANGIAPLGLTAFEATAYALGFPFMMSCSAGISSFLYRKTGNIWTGVFTSSFVLIFLTCNAALFTV